MMEHYYALFKKAPEAIEVEFPDLQGCVTFGKTWEEALENAEDVLAKWLEYADVAFVKKPSTHDQLKSLEGKLVPITLNQNKI